MIGRLILVSSIAAAACLSAAYAQQAAAPDTSTPPAATVPAPPASIGTIPAPPASAASPVSAPAPQATPEAQALNAAITALSGGNDDEERNEHAALLSFYAARGYAPLWLTPAGEFTLRAEQATAELKRAGEWGLDPRDFPLPPAGQTPEAPAANEIALSLTVLKYGRYARGGRISNPPELLSSYLDRRPQLLKPAAILEGIAAAEQPDAYLRGLHPAHPQFEKLRQKYLALPGKGKKPGAASAEAKRLLANMEEWRWMPADMGNLYVWNNIPEFMQRVVKDGNVVRTERIIGGELSKQTPVFTRPMRKITFKPTWKVPDSIKVRELWPSLLKGGGLMREWALEVRTKDGQPVDWRKMNWAATDIRLYDVIQENGPKSVMGKVKFSFPSQHTVFMHDTMEQDKWMFKAARRTYSHGCMRVANPIGLAEVLLQEDKGLDAEQVREMVRTGPNNNEISLDRKIMVHMTYFTAIVDDNGKLNTFPDVYGHEQRITLALEGKWNRIVKGRDHLAPVELDLASAARHRATDDGKRQQSSEGVSGFFNLFSGNSGY
jgi:murein L,D-transpeptidase YcbB/YkuD